MATGLASKANGSEGRSASTRDWDGLAPKVVRSSAADRLRALGHQERLRIVEALAGGPMNVSDLAATVRRPGGVVSRHLRVLHAAQIVDCSRCGNHVLYVLADREVARLAAVAYSGAALQLRRTIALVPAEPDPAPDE